MAALVGSTTIQTTNSPILPLVGLDLDVLRPPAAYEVITPHLYANIAKYVHALQCIIAVGGMLGNALSMRTFLKIGLLDSATITFFNLAISDFFLLVTIALHAVCFFNDIAMIESYYDAANGTFSYYNTILGLDPHLLSTCFLSILNLFYSVSSSLIAFLAIQRSLCVIRPLHVKGMFTRCKTLGIVVLIWSYWFNIFIAQWSFFRFRKTDHGFAANVTRIELEKITDSPASKRFTNYNRLVNYIILPSIFLVVVFAGLSILSYSLVMSLRFRHTSTSSTSRAFSAHQDSGGSERGPANDNDAESKQTTGTISTSKERRAILQVAILSAFFLLSQLPFILWDVVLVIRPELGESSVYFYLQGLISNVCTIMDVANASVNFLVYYKFNTKFRNACFQRQRKH